MTTNVLPLSNFAYPTEKMNLGDHYYGYVTDYVVPPARTFIDAEGVVWTSPSPYKYVDRFRRILVGLKRENKTFYRDLTTDEIDTINEVIDNYPYNTMLFLFELDENNLVDKNEASDYRIAIYGDHVFLNPHDVSLREVREEYRPILFSTDDDVTKFTETLVREDD